MKVLAIDFGTKRFGVAVGEGGRIIYSKVLTGKRVEDFLRDIATIVRDEQAGTVVFGLPLRMDGSEKKEAREVRQFAMKLSKETKVPVVFVDERLTSEEAQSILREQGLTEREIRGKVDQKVAELLLDQHFRDRH